MTTSPYDRLRIIAVTGLFSDDDLLDTIVFKGGNAMYLVYQLAARTSIDLDFSIQGDFSKEKLGEIEAKFQTALENQFETNGYKIFDWKFASKPKEDKGQPDFWGGYQIQFKIVSKPIFDLYINNLSRLRVNAESIDPTDKKNLQIDISKFEYTDGKIIKELDDYAIYVDSPAMIVLSKLRALCQQTDQYANIIGRRYKKPRARDFFDIYTTVNEFNINLCTNENLEVLYGIFACKNVSLDLLDEIKSLRDFHKEDFASVRGTILPNIEVRDFEFYFDFVLALIEKLKASGIK